MFIKYQDCANNLHVKIFENSKLLFASFNIIIPNQCRYRRCPLICGQRADEIRRE